jgi:hypothetical protein
VAAAGRLGTGRQAEADLIRTQPALKLDARLRGDEVVLLRVAAVAAGAIRTAAARARTAATSERSAIGFPSEREPACVRSPEGRPPRTKRKPSYQLGLRQNRRLSTVQSEESGRAEPLMAPDYALNLAG